MFNRIFLQTHVTFCEYFMFHEFRRTTCILLLLNILNKKVSQIYFFEILDTVFSSIDAVLWYNSCRLLYDISDMFFIALCLGVFLSFYLNKYQNHIKIFIDGSILDSLDSGSEFVIPELKVQKSFYLGNGFSIFTSELYAILLALHYMCNIKLAIFTFLICWFKISYICIA